MAGFFQNTTGAFAGIQRARQLALQRQNLLANLAAQKLAVERAAKQDDLAERRLGLNERRVVLEEKEFESAEEQRKKDVEFLEKFKSAYAENVQRELPGGGTSGLQTLPNPTGDVANPQPIPPAGNLGQLTPLMKQMAQARAYTKTLDALGVPPGGSRTVGKLKFTNPSNDARVRLGLQIQGAELDQRKFDRSGRQFERQQGLREQDSQESREQFERQQRLREEKAERDAIENERNFAIRLREQRRKDREAEAEAAAPREKTLTTDVAEHLEGRGITPNLATPDQIAQSTDAVEKREREGKIAVSAAQGREAAAIRAEERLAEDEPAKIIIDRLDALSKKVITATTPIGALVEGFVDAAGAFSGLSIEDKAYADLREGFTSVIARKFGGEKGPIPEADTKRAGRLLPAFGDTAQVRDAKIRMLRDIFQAGVDAQERIKAGGSVRKEQSDMKAAITAAEMLVDYAAGNSRPKDINPRSIYLTGKVKDGKIVSFWQTSNGDIQKSVD